MKKIIVLAIMMVCSVAFAGDIKLSNTITQDEFAELAKEIGMIVTPTPNSPAEPLKTFGFDVALETAVIDISDDQDYWKKAWDGSDPDGMVYAYRVHAQKGFPFGLDLGASVTQGGNIGFTAITGEVKYALLKGSVVMPAVSLKTSVTKVFGLTDLDITTFSFGGYISKGILMFTPYAGAEAIYTMADATDDTAVDGETISAYRGLVGLQFSPLPLISINAEMATGTVTQYGIKAGIRF
jgi:hypothetical protein